MNIVTVLFFMMYVARDSKTQDSYGSYEHMIADQDEGNDANMKTEKGITTFQGDRYFVFIFIQFNDINDACICISLARPADGDAQGEGC